MKEVGICSREASILGSRTFNVQQVVDASLTPSTFPYGLGTRLGGCLNCVGPTLFYGATEFYYPFGVFATHWEWLLPIGSVCNNYVLCFIAKRLSVRFIIVQARWALVDLSLRLCLYVCMHVCMYVP